MSTLSNLYALQAKYQQKIQDAQQRLFEIGNLINATQDTFRNVLCINTSYNNCAQSLANGVKGSRSAGTSVSEIEKDYERYSSEDNCLSSALYYFNQEIQKLNNDIELARSNLQSVEHQIQAEKERIRQEELARQRAEQERRARQLAEAGRKIVKYFYH
jgi:chromosome segregation ATPase